MEAADIEGPIGMMRHAPRTTVRRQSLSAGEGVVNISLNNSENVNLEITKANGPICFEQSSRKSADISRVSISTLGTDSQLKLTKTAAD